MLELLEDSLKKQVVALVSMLGNWSPPISCRYYGSVFFCTRDVNRMCYLLEGLIPVLCSGNGPRRNFWRAHSYSFIGTGTASPLRRALLHFGFDFGLLAPKDLFAAVFFHASFVFRRASLQSENYSFSHETISFKCFGVRGRARLEADLGRRFWQRA